MYDREIAYLRGESESLRERLSQLSELSRIITSKLELAAVLQPIAEVAGNLASGKYGALTIFDPSGRVRSFSTHGITSEQRALLGELFKSLGLLRALQDEQAKQGDSNPERMGNR